MTAFRRDPPPEQLREMLTYRDGFLYWKPEFTKGAGNRKARALGTINKNGYRTCRILVDDYGTARSFYMHRLIYWFLKGEWPAVIDHINRDKLDCRIENLRDVSQQVNAQNKSMHSNNTTGYQGVTTEYGKFSASVYMNYKKYKIYGYKTKEAAALARDLLTRLLYPGKTDYRIIDNNPVNIGGIVF